MCVVWIVTVKYLSKLIFVDWFNNLASGNVRGFRAIKNWSYMALRERNSGTESGRELFRGLKDLASLLVCPRKNFFGWGCGFFVTSTFRPPWPTSPGPGPKLFDSSISLKFLLETRLQSESFDTFDDLLGFKVQKLWFKINKILD